MNGKGACDERERGKGRWGVPVVPRCVVAMPDARWSAGSRCVCVCVCVNSDTKVGRPASPGLPYSLKIQSGETVLVTNLQTHMHHYHHHHHYYHHHYYSFEYYGDVCVCVCVGDPS